MKKLGVLAAASVLAAACSSPEDRAEPPVGTTAPQVSAAPQPVEDALTFETVAPPDRTPGLGGCAPDAVVADCYATTLYYLESKIVDADRDIRRCAANTLASNMGAERLPVSNADDYLVENLPDTLVECREATQGTAVAENVVASEVNPYGVPLSEETYICLVGSGATESIEGVATFACLTDPEKMSYLNAHGGVKECASAEAIEWADSDPQRWEDLSSETVPEFNC